MIKSRSTFLHNDVLIYTWKEHSKTHPVNYDVYYLFQMQIAGEIDNYDIGTYDTPSSLLRVCNLIEDNKHDLISLLDSLVKDYKCRKYKGMIIGSDSLLKDIKNSENFLIVQDPKEEERKRKSWGDIYE